MYIINAGLSGKSHPHTQSLPVGSLVAPKKQTLYISKKPHISKTKASFSVKVTRERNVESTDSQTHQEKKLLFLQEICKSRCLPHLALKTSDHFTEHTLYCALSAPVQEEENFFSTSFLTHSSPP